MRIADRITRAGALLGLSALAATACHRGAATGRTAPQAGIAAAAAASGATDPAVFWNAATVYFLLTDRFLDADTGNDHALGRAQDGAVLRSFVGGDLKGVTEKIEAGYFDSLGVDAIWLTPFVEQVRGSVDEGTGRTYAYHGYWARDWTAVDPALGTKADLHALVDAAHRHRIRVLMDAVINHPGPVTPFDPGWPADWVRTDPTCTYRSYATTVDCDLVPTLPDFRTESDQPVELPPFLVEKWRREGRLEQEQASLDAWFRRTGHPRAPRYYLIKWLTDWVREFGIDGYRVDTAKHFGAAVSAELRQEADRAFADWKKAHPDQVLDDLPFYMVGEVMGWDAGQGRTYSYGDSSVDFFAHGYDALINMGFKRDAGWPLDSLFTRYSAALHQGALRGVAILNYVSSHDDGQPYDPDRRDPLGAGTRLLLAPGGAQIYYGDELARPLRVPGAQGDANLRSPMDWNDLRRGRTLDILRHWRRLGAFRREHPAVGAGEQHTLQALPYVFSRTLDAGDLHDRVVVAMDQPLGVKRIAVAGVFPDGTDLTDGYSGERATVRDGVVSLNTGYGLVLLGVKPPEEEAGPDSVVVNVINHYALPMDAYAVGGGTEYRMGIVYPGTQRRFLLRQATLATGPEVEFVAQPTGYGPRVSGGVLDLRRGDVVEFEIATNLRGSVARIRKP